MPAAAQPESISYTLVDHRKLRLAIVFLLYVAQGLPLGMFYFALPGWQASNGVSAAGIGAVLAMTSLPWSLKLINGIIMDRFAFLAMGRRRPWVIAGQAAIVTGLIVMAVISPAPNDILLLGGLAFAINIATTVQDVAVDGLAIDVIPEDEYGRCGGYMIGGQAIGIAISATMSGQLIAAFGLSAALLALAALVGAMLVLAILVRERPGERLMPWSAGTASAVNVDRHLGAFGKIIIGVLKAIFNRPTLTILPAIFLAGAADGLFLGIAPLFGANILGWGDGVYAGWSGPANLISGLLGVLVFGLLAERFGAKRMFVMAHLLSGGAALAVLALRPEWASPQLLIIAIFVFSSLLIFQLVTASAVAIRLCSPAVAATQFSLFMATINLGAVAASALLGTLDAWGGFDAMFSAMVVIGILGAAFAFAAKVGR